MSRIAREIVHRIATASAAILGLLREIGDENAYRRHLAVRNREHSAAEWRAFSERRLRTKYIRPKCC